MLTMPIMRMVVDDGLKIITIILIIICASAILIASVESLLQNSARSQKCPMHRCSWLVILLFRLDNCPDNHFCSEIALVFPFIVFTIIQHSWLNLRWNLLNVSTDLWSHLSRYFCSGRICKRCSATTYMLSAQLWYFPGAPFVFGIWDAHFEQLWYFPGALFVFGMRISTDKLIAELCDTSDTVITE